MSNNDRDEHGVPRRPSGAPRGGQPPRARSDGDAGSQLSPPARQNPRSGPGARPAQPPRPTEAGQPGEPPPGGRRKRPKTKKQYRVLRALLVTVALVLFCIFLAYFVLQSASDFLGISINVAGLEQEDATVTVNIPEGSSAGEIVKLLNKSGVVDTPLSFRVYSKLKKAEGFFKPGEYVLNKNMSYDQIIIALKSGDERQDVVRISFPEGLSLWEVGKKLEEQDVCTAQEFADALEQLVFEYDFMKDIPVDDPLRFYKYEGYVFPNTYDFFIPEAPTSVAKKFFNSFNDNITADMYDRMREMGMTLDETITLASIIQKEASFPEDMNMVSGVFHNRFKQEDTYPQMQSDVTIFYVEKFIKPQLTTVNQAMYDAYNTYKCVGLPVGPICNPGMEAIKAALYPEESNYYYFLTDKEGKFYYAATLEEHNQNIRAATQVGVAGGIATD